MNSSDTDDWFQAIDTIVSEPLRFKVKLAIGEDAYASLRLKNAALKTWDTAGVAVAASTIAGSSAVASTFFAPTGWLAALGFGTAVTPIGWVIAAGAISAGAWLGITRYLKNSANSRVTVIPNFINTPMDVLALGLFDLMAPLALKIASLKGEIEAAESNLIESYFINEWGFNRDFVLAGLNYAQVHLGDISIEELARSLAEFKKANPDCNYRLMAEEIHQFLLAVTRVGKPTGVVEQEAIDAIQSIFSDVAASPVRKKLGAVWQRLKTIPANIKRTKNSKS